MKLTLNFIQTMLFGLTWYFTDLYLATIVLIFCAYISVLILRITEKRWDRWHMGLAGLITVFGGMTLYFQNPLFLQFKFSLVYTLIAIALLTSHFFGDKVLLARLPQKDIQLPDTIWRKVNLAWVFFFAGNAVLNIYIATHFSNKIWGYYKFAGVPAFTVIFMLGHVPFLARYLPKES